MMGFSIKYDTPIAIEGIPREWIPLISLYNTALPQFPLLYVHIKENNDRVFGFPVHYNLSETSNGSVVWEFKFLSNIPLKGPLLDKVKVELRHRLGIEDAVTRQDIKNCCDRGDVKDFLLQIWDSFIVPSFGGSLPFGQFYDEMHSFVRCAAAFIPLSGGKSELQMLYDFIRHYGERVEIAPPWGFLEFFLLPTYDELLDRKLDDFPTYRTLQNAMDKFAKLFFGNEIDVNGLSLKTVKDKISNLLGYDIRSPNGMRDLTNHLVGIGELTVDEKRELDFLIDAFNRLATRALGFIGLAVNATSNNDLRKWDRDLFQKLYNVTESQRSVGVYPKIWGMILQQGFGNPEAVPIDSWIEAFYSIPLQIKSKSKFLDTFRGIGKVERMMWMASQARKTNMAAIFEWLWCLKYGTGGTTTEITGGRVSRLRKANPLSCLNCPLKVQCIAYNNSKANSVYVKETSGKVPVESKIKAPAKADFIVLTFDSVPKYVFKRVSGEYFLIDGFTGLEIHELKTSFKNTTTDLSSFVQDLLS